MFFIGILVNYKVESEKQKAQSEKATKKNFHLFKLRGL
jgi:hypothetical protein